MANMKDKYLKQERFSCGLQYEAMKAKYKPGTR
jgi:hypothetical protein